MLQKVTPENNLSEGHGKILNIYESSIKINNEHNSNINVLSSGEKREKLTVIECCNAEGQFLPTCSNSNRTSTRNRSSVMAYPRVICVHEPETVLHWHGLVHQVVHRNLQSGFSDDNTDSHEGHVQQEGDNVDCDPTFEESCSSSEPHLLTHGDLNDIVRDLNLSKTQAELIVSRLYKWNLLDYESEICLYQIRQN